MPDTPAAATMPVPLGVHADSGDFEQPIDRGAMRALRTKGPGGSLSQGIIKAKAESNEAHLGIVGGDMVAEDLAQAGWAVLYGPSVSEAIKQELKPLLEHRKNEVESGEFFKVFEDYQPGQSAAEWLATPPRNATMQVVDPANGVPFYVLIVASPEEISFEFQYELDLYWGVGRLWFSTPEEFGCYAKSVIDYEKAAEITTSRQLALFGTHQEFDEASKVLYANVFDPWIQGHFGQRQKFALQLFMGADATKDKLRGLWSGEAPGGTPALLFTGSHGLLRAPDSKHLIETQGALLCQDWPGGPAKADHYYAARDLPANTKVHGMIHFLFACYGGGWPRFDTYKRDENGDGIPIAPSPMLARLPQALLGRENGALAVLGHVDKAFGYSYSTKGQPQNQGFRDVLIKLMNGYRLGNATDQFNFRWAALSTELLKGIDSLKTGDGRFTQSQVANLWVARDDARNYMLHGDPAVRLRVKDMPPVAAIAT
ncbi:MAG: hypothetical protein R2762_16965 [Bryobacteraceae bacterium]